MRLITLNIWGGTMRKELLNFILDYEQSTDIFCFQEVFHLGGDGFSRLQPLHADRYIFASISDLLAQNFDGWFVSSYPGEEGLATFYRKTLEDPYGAKATYYVHGSQKSFNGYDVATLGRPLQYTRIGGVDVAHFHGWISGDNDSKQDNQQRLAMAACVRGYTSLATGNNRPLIICGDFNLALDSKALYLVGHGLRNLCKEFGVPTTRPGFCDKYENRVVDHIIVSRDVNVEHFEVLPQVVSDHLALCLDFSIAGGK